MCTHSPNKRILKTKKYLKYFTHRNWIIKIPTAKTTQNILIETKFMKYFTTTCTTKGESRSEWENIE